MAEDAGSAGGAGDKLLNSKRENPNPKLILCVKFQKEKSKFQV
jgi:hypothetical protein